MFVKRISNIEGTEIDAKLIETDPHGKLVALYSVNNHSVHVVSIQTIIQYFENYRLLFAQKHKYSLGDLELAEEAKFDCLNKFSSVQFIRFS